MRYGTKAAAGAVLAGGLILGAFATPATAQVEQDGLVNVNVGDVTILEDVRIGIAALVVANICPAVDANVAVLARIVDRSGETDLVCTADGAPITIEQN